MRRVENQELQETTGIQEGDILAGKYRVDKVLGAGGMGIVVAARHLQLDTRVAIKFLLPELAQSGDAVSRFAREARAAVKITGEHVARVLDVGTLESGSPYMVMEYLDGIDLSAWLRRHGPLPIEQAVDFVLQACVAVGEAHSLGIVHRDLKPANLFCIRRAGQLLVKVLDFGISKEHALGGLGGATQTGMLMGSPLYMSPEQMMSAKDVDARSDIWALGIILQELVGGSCPFQGDTLPEICTKVAMGNPIPLRVARPDAPAAFEAVILKCLSKDRNARYANVGELAEALVPFGPARGRAYLAAILAILQPHGELVWASASTQVVTGPVQAVSGPVQAVRGPVRAVSGPVQVGTQTPAHASIPTFGWTKAGRPRRKPWGWIAGVAAVLGIGTVALVVLQTDAKPRPASEASGPIVTGDLAAGAQTAAAGAQTAPTPRAAEAVEPPPAAPVAPREVIAAPKATAEEPLPPVKPSPAPVAPNRAPRGARPAAAHAPPAATVNAPGTTAAPHPAAPAPHPAAATNCDPPFFFDDQGNRVFKRECVN
jgi:hypothetical protein